MNRSELETPARTVVVDGALAAGDSNGTIAPCFARPKLADARCASLHRLAHAGVCAARLEQEAA